MPQAAIKHTKPDPTAQFRTRGYVVDEEHDIALNDVATGLMAIAQICDEAGDNFPELNGDEFAAIFRVFGQQVKHIRDAAPFTDTCEVRPRNIH